MSQHADFAPSAAHRWMECPASVRYIRQMREAVPELELDTNSPASELGSRAHALAERCLSSQLTFDDALGAFPNPVWEPVRMYVDYVRSEVMPRSTRWLVEHRLDIHPPHIFGTADFIGLSPDRLEIVDLKFGRIPVQITANSQLSLYAAGALQLYPDGEEPKEVVLTIVQPLVYGEPRSWTATVREIRIHMERAKAAVRNVDQANPHVGEWCQYCPARDKVCPMYPTDPTIVSLIERNSQ